MSKTEFTLNRLHAASVLATMVICIWFMSAMAMPVSLAVIALLLMALNRQVPRQLLAGALMLSGVSVWFTYAPHAVPGLQSTPWALAPLLIATGLVSAPFIGQCAITAGMAGLFVLTTLGTIFGYIDLQAGLVASAGGLFKDVNLASAITAGTAAYLWGRTKDSWLKKLAVLVPLLGTYAISLSRSSMLSLLGAVLITALAVWVFKKNPRISKAVFILGVCGWISGPYVAAGLLNPENLGIALQSRLAIAQSAVGYLVNLPPSQLLLGSGTGSWPVVYDSIRTARDINSSGLYAHNDWIEVVVENGFAGIAFLLTLIILVTQRVAVKSGKFLDKVAVVSLLVFSGFNFYFASAMGCLLFGLLLGKLTPTSSISKAEQVNSTGLKALVLLLALSPFLFYLPLQTYWALNSQKEHLGIKQAYAAKLMLGLSYFEPWQMSAVQRIDRIGGTESKPGEVASVGKELSIAKREINTALAIYPDCFKCKVLRAHIEAAMNNREMAVRDATELLETAPYSRPALVAALRINNQYEFLNKEHKRSIALRCVQKSLSLEEATECAKITK